MEKVERQEMRKEIIKKLNRARKIDSEARQLKSELDNLVSNYFEEYNADYHVSSAGYSNIDGLYDTILAFVENGEFGGADLWKATRAKNGNEFMKNAEKWHKENGNKI